MPGQQPPASRNLPEHGQLERTESFVEYWQQGGETNQINALVVSLHHNQISTNAALKNRLDELLGHIGQNVPMNIGWETFKTAIHRYNAQYAYSLKVTDELEDDFKEKFNKRTNI